MFGQPADLEAPGSEGTSLVWNAVPQFPPRPHVPWLHAASFKAVPELHVGVVKQPTEDGAEALVLVLALIKDKKVS